MSHHLLHADKGLIILVVNPTTFLACWDLLDELLLRLSELKRLCQAAKLNGMQCKCFGSDMKGCMSFPARLCFGDVSTAVTLQVIHGLACGV